MFDSAPAALLVRYKAGLNQQKIAKAVKLSPIEVSRRLRKACPVSLKRVRRWRRQNRELMLDYVCLRSLSKVATKHGLTKGCARGRLVSLHPKYATLARTGALLATADYLNSRKAKIQSAKSAKVREWFISELPKIIQAELHSEVPTLSTTEQLLIDNLERRFDERAHCPERRVRATRDDKREKLRRKSNGYSYGKFRRYR